MIAPAKQRLKRMLVGIESGQCLDPQQGGKKQGLKAPPQRLLAVMQQREVIVGLGALMGLDGLGELGHNRAKGIVLIEPMGKEMHAHTRQMRRDLDDRCARTNRTAPCGLILRLLPDLVRRALVPDVLITAHSAAVSVNFYTGTQFPQRYRNGAFVGLHGSWNRSKVSGYRIGFVPFQNGKPSGPIEDFVTGWIVDGGTPATAWGRPVGTLVMRDGSMLVADDAGNKIWKVRYTGKN